MGTFNAQASEYDQIGGQLKSLHETHMTSINQAATQLRVMAMGDGGFQTQFTSAKILQLLDVIDSQIIPAMAVSFRQSEKIMSDFISKTKAADHV